MSDRETLEKISHIMHQLLLIRMDGLNPIPRKGTTRHECYRALYEIQELLETRRAFWIHQPQTNADKIRQMSDEELAEWLAEHQKIGDTKTNKDGYRQLWLDWLKQEEQS